MNEIDAGMVGQRSAAQLVVPCADLDRAIAFYTDTLGFRLDMVMPADAPRVAVVSGHGIALRLERVADHTNAAITLRIELDRERRAAFDSGTLDAPDGVRIELVDRDSGITCRPATNTHQDFTLSRAGDAGAPGRAGMHYRDLIPGRMDGRVIASHIRIPDGGPVPDYVHAHTVGFQVIYCRRGWVRVVYEDQGEPFVMHAGDCVLQPPTIRHRVLAASAGLEVIELGAPAEHETIRDHDMELPTAHRRPERMFGGQRFVRHVAPQADWHTDADGGFEYRDTGIAEASGGVASVRVLRSVSNDDGHPARPAANSHRGELLFLMVLQGRLKLDVENSGAHTLDIDDACVIPAGARYVLEAAPDSEILEVAMPAALPVAS